jgi:uncharacterized membrane protein
MPIYSLEITQIAKSMVAELFFALAILAMVSTWRWQYKGITIVVCTVLATVSHYSVGLAMLCYLFGIIIVRLATSRIRWKLFAMKRVSAVMLALALIISSGAFYAYYHYAYGGAVNGVIGTVAKYYGGKAITYSGFVFKPSDTSTGEKPLVETESSTVQSSEVPKTRVTTEKDESYFYEQENLVKVAIGLDFFGQPIEGKLFRIIQYLTQALIVIGAIYLLFRHSRYKFTSEFVAGIGCSFVLLFCCIFVPQFSHIINMSRFYQVSLFFLAPMLILGCEALGGIKK